MASREAWCADKLSKLLNEELRISTLNEIKEHFSVLSQNEANETANVLQLPIVFDCLNDSKTEQIDLACEVLSLCMSNLSLGESTNKYGASLERALYHPSSNVKMMALKEIYRTAFDNESITVLYQHTSLVIALVVCVGDDDLAVAKKASDILILIAKSKAGIRTLLSSEIMQVISQTLAISDIVRFRIYEILVEVAKESEESLQYLLPLGLLHSLVAEIDSNDPLLKLNVLELLSNLAFSNHGFLFLQSQGVIQKVSNNMSMIKEDHLAVLTLPGLLKFFGNIAYWKPIAIFTEYPMLYDILYDIIKSGDDLVLGVAYDTLGHIASTNDGKITLDMIGDKTKTTLKSTWEQLASLPTDLRIRALNCFENILRVPPSAQNNRISSLVYSWFTELATDPMSYIVQCSQNPFVEIRCAGLGILHALSDQEWGQEQIKNNPGLIEFLLDRRTETAKEPKEIKYQIIKTLSVSPVFDENTLGRLQQYVKEGPFYVQAITEVAIEGGS